MSSTIQARKSGQTGFRARLLLAMMLVVSAISAVGLYVVQAYLAAQSARELQAQFRAELALRHNAQQVRHAALAERCRALAQRPRIHAALEDDALDLLYLSAKDELRDIVDQDGQPAEPAARTLRAEFYRFVAHEGVVTAPPKAEGVGELQPAEEKQLALKALPRQQQLGYVVRKTRDSGDAVAELIAVPIISTVTDEPIAALVLGFKPTEAGAGATSQAMYSGIWLDGRLHWLGLAGPAGAGLASDLERAIGSPDHSETSLTVRAGGLPHLLFYKQLNPESQYPPAYEVCAFPLTQLRARQRHARWQVLGAGALMLLIGFVASHYSSARLSAPVERLALDSELNRAGRERAESALEQTSEELQRSVRFSADASHQLKTPATVLRAGLEELLTNENLTLETRGAISDLIHQTYRLASVIEDLLLLSRMDAGRLQLAFAPVDLSHLIEAELDDLSAQPNTLDLAVEPEFPPALQVLGEKAYTTLVLRNLLENARKYNRQEGRIRITAQAVTEEVLLTIGNTGRPIPLEAQKYIFDRFHRGAAGENIPGHGLGLNIAHELARLHGGDLRLVCSHDDWTEFTVRFRAAKLAQSPAQGAG